ncbi:HNH endonuclease [Halorussus marinus]|uniref:HNH endonuclease n=1 Tax=Halorussus marinus TaxID=2505976 RepID=UPI00143CCE98|nr:HNH endonuclease [Halorussus marinus]
MILTMRHSNYPSDWQKRRARVFKRDGYECQNCEYQAPTDSNSPSGLHAHHQTKISEGGGHGVDNLITLCQECHIEVHSNRGVDEVPPPELHECTYDGCDEVRGKWALQNGGYCTAQCEYRDKAEAVLDALQTEETFCSSCFANWPPDHEVCPQCGNWAPDEDAAFQDGDFDIHNLVAHVIWQVDFLDLERD